MVSIALILIIILGIISFSLYHYSSYDNKGNKIGCLDTIRNIFGFEELYDDARRFAGWVKEEIEEETVENEEKNNKEETTEDVVVDTEDTSEKVLTGDTLYKLAGDYNDTTDDDIKEVYNIDNSDLTYDEANLICKAHDAELATYQQLVKAHEKGLMV